MTMDLPGLLVGACIGAVLGVVAQSLLQPFSDRATFHLFSRLRPGRAHRLSLDGIWRSRYVYETSNPESSLLEDEHFLVLRTHGERIRVQSLPRPEGSDLTVNLEIEGSVATGLWRELTPDHKRLYHGACQFKINPAGDSLAGTWIGFSRDGDEIRNGDWRWKRVSYRRGRRGRRGLQDQPDLAWRSAVASTSD